MPTTSRRPGTAAPPKPAFSNGLLGQLTATGCQDASVPAAPRPLITRRTDFGTRDAYVASLKGVILSLKPAAQIVDLSRGVAPAIPWLGPP